MEKNVIFRYTNRNPVEDYNGKCYIITGQYSDKIKTIELYSHYKQYCKETLHTPLGQMTFHKYMVDHPGIHYHKSGVYFGVKVITDFEVNNHPIPETYHPLNPFFRGNKNDK